MRRAGPLSPEARARLRRALLAMAADAMSGVHRIVPRSHGGTTHLSGLVLLCGYHHQVCIHRHGRKIILHADGTKEAISPHGEILRSHGPP